MHFCDMPESYARIIYLLSDSLAKDYAAPNIQSLKANIKRKADFAQLAERMVAETRKTEPELKQFMNEIWNNYLKDNVPMHLDGYQRLELTAQYIFLRAIDNLSSDEIRYYAVCRAVEALGRTNESNVHVGGASQRAGAPQQVVAVLQEARAPQLVDVFWGFCSETVVNNIRKWWDGEISGKTCVTNIIGNVDRTLFNKGGASVGSAIGTGLWGADWGAAVGSGLGGNVANALYDWLFGLPKNKALDNAYKFIGLSETSSDSEFNSRYRQLALIYHPDKGGDRDKWNKLVCSVALIKKARGIV